MKYLALLAALMSLPALADNAEPSPVGCYRLAMLFPKALENGFSGSDAIANVNSNTDKEICLTQSNVRDASDGMKTGTYNVKILSAGKPVVSYDLAYSLEDGSGHHVDFLFAKTAEDITKIGNTDAYARGNAGPAEKVIYYILVEGPVKSGGYAGSVSLNEIRYTLIRK